MDPRLLEPTGPPDVRGLVESGLEFDEHGDLLALFGRLDAGIDDRATAGGAVERDLDGQHVGVVRGLVDELDDRAAERLVRVLNEDITSSISAKMSTGSSSGCSRGSTTPFHSGQRRAGRSMSAISLNEVGSSGVRAT